MKICQAASICTRQLKMRSGTLVYAIIALIFLVQIHWSDAVLQHKAVSKTFSLVLRIRCDV